MSQFKQLLQESKKVYTYRLKTVVPLDDARMDILERFLRRYDLLSMGAPHGLDPIHDSLEFRDLDNAEVNSVDFSIGVPMSAYILQQEIRACLSLPEKFLVVRADNEPVEVEGSRNQMLRDLDKIAQEKGFSHKSSLLSTNREYLPAEQPSVQDVYGDEYNKRFLNMLAQVAATRKNQVFQSQSDLNDLNMITSTSQEPKQDVADFNDKHDTPKPVYKVDKKIAEPVASAVLAPDGNLDDDSKTYFRADRTPQGDTVIHQIHADPVRKGGKGAQK
jgi:hypothetical protein